MNKQKLYKDRDWLEEQYVEKGLSTTEIAEKIGSSANTISRYLHKLNILKPSGFWQEIKCDQCGKTFQKNKERIDELNFCSRKCSHEHRKDREKVICDNCGDEFEKLSSEVRDHNFCSHECFREFSSEEGNTAICDWCGKEFHKPPKEMKEHNFCSRECYYSWQRNGGAPTGEDHHNYSQKQVECAYCGEKFSVEKNHFEKRENFFCSHECYSKYLENGWVWGICEQCGERFLKSVHLYKRSDHHFCSQKCSEEFHKGKRANAWRGGYEPYYGPNWDRQRRKVLEKDNYTCQECGTKEDLVVHHKVPMRVFKDKVNDDNEKVDWESANALSNLVTLCRSCHRKIETNPEYAKKFGTA